MSAGEPTYLNNAGTSWPKAPGVADAVARTLAADPRDYGSIFEAARERIARCLAVGDASELLLTPGCTSALATMINAMPWRAGDVVVTSAVEHKAMLAPIHALVRNAGVVHRVVSYREGPAFDLDALDGILSAGNVGLVAVTAASNVTGERLPTVDIADRARVHGVATLVDAAQVVGLTQEGLPAFGAECVAFAGHKGPLAPQGIGGLWVAPGFSVRPGYCEVGSVDLPGAVAMAHSLEWLHARDAPAASPVELRARLAEGLRARARCTVLGSDTHTTATLSLLHEGLPVAEAEAYFAQHGIVVRAGQHCASAALEMLGAPKGTIRLSFGPFNTQADVEAVLRAVDAVP